ncbi:hypothetical protein [Orenia marismortui]|uniref:Uncharacterized protein n=1 Tax=Orenia marismortui TaxID=46469 RepID=A0A4R8GT07_9FIRM|nr:hypothetical protein [Orenia marismortui]TDX49128.1 hypothetical protein C7959_12022 [Orenia marismortui]
MKKQGVAVTVNQLRKKMMKDFSAKYQVELASLSSNSCTYDLADKFIKWLKVNLESVSNIREDQSA